MAWHKAPGGVNIHVPVPKPAMPSLNPPKAASKERAMTISDAPWNGSPSQWKDTDAYCSSCLIDLNDAGKDKTQENCKLPVKFPNGDISRNAVHSAASALAGGRGGVNAPAQEKKKAAKAIVRLYSELKEDPPESIKKMAQ